MDNRDKHKDNGIILGHGNLLNLSKEVMRMAVNDPELLNAVYKEVSEKLGMDVAMTIYQMFRGQQISFPMRFFNPERIQKIIVQEYDGTNIKTLAIKYGYFVVYDTHYIGEGSFADWGLGEDLYELVRNENP